MQVRGKEQVREGGCEQREHRMGGFVLPKRTQWSPKLRTGSSWC